MPCNQVNKLKKIILGTIFISFTLGFNQIEKKRKVESGEFDYDMLSVNVCRQGLESLLLFMQQSSVAWGLSDSLPAKIILLDKKIDLLITWGSLLDYLAQLDHVKNTYRNSLFIDEEEYNYDHFIIYYAAFLNQYRFALEFLDLAEKNPAVHVILNEANLEYGLEDYTYRRFKLHFLNIVIATEFMALKSIYKQVSQENKVYSGDLLEEDVNFLLKMGYGSGLMLTFKNALRIFQDASHALFSPVQKGVASWMGETKVWRKNRILISKENVDSIELKLQPADIIFERREWNLTNAGIPGYWTHTALFIGTPETRKKFLYDKEVESWVKSAGVNSGDFENLLQKTYPAAYAKSILENGYGRNFKILEAVAEGVIFNTVNKSFACDGVSVLRPRLSRRDKAQAIFRAFSYSGRPYDYNFNFLTDTSLVCTELIYKSFEPDQEFTGLNIPVIKIGDRLLISANGIVKQFDENYGSENQQLDFILFYDGHEKKGISIPVSLADFRESWKRHDWYLFFQE
ncbi:MAG: YiiX/YebB-like N1pC/P60 family cysteine hydrolase [Candidatus Neomarinimicrobiota bacterium]